MKQPWLPKRPLHQTKCKHCKGTGSAYYWASWKVLLMSCDRCGGKGFK